MAINKELYERYKAMKAAKLAALENNTETDTTASQGVIQAPYETTTVSKGTNNGFNNQTPLFSSEIEVQKPLESSNWESMYSTPDLYSQKQEETPQPKPMSDYNNQFKFTHPQASNYTTSETPVIETANEVKPQLKKFALIGYPLGHSLSEYIQLAGFKSLGIKATYELLPTAPEELVDRIKYLRNNGYSGFNVTIPLKLPVAMFLDEVDSSANIVKAINTVIIDPQTNALKGYNTDVTGFIKAVPEDVSLYNKTIAILGTGGAARAAITALAQKQVREIKLYTRNITNCIELLEYLRKSFPSVEFNAYQIDKFKDLSGIDMVVNATPIGMSGQAVGYSPLEENELTTLPNHAIIYDVVYNPKKTNLIKLAQKYNYKTVTGLDMLIYQAQEAQKIWTGLTPDFKDMKIAALENLD